ncbi:hypothetical protein DL95DRAFT_289072 [Leptodontidium sp. 2 PMI_412]|nr:hypothetical protein DL95DRAFT_289072 [Leptodontidium sp. 2 PMI_412]
MTLYKYRQIDLDRPAIRLLRLLGGSLADDIHCHIFDGWLNQSGGGIPYHALSYTWGTTEKVAKLFVNGGILYVTFNLYTALQHLRFEDEDRSCGLMLSVLIRTTKKSEYIKFNKWVGYIKPPNELLSG